MFDYRIAEVSEDLNTGLQALRVCRPGLFSDSGVRLAFISDEGLAEGSYQVDKTGDAFAIRYRRRIDAFRAIGRLAGRLQDGLREGFSESTQYTMLGAMYDLSRNGVLHLPAFRKILCQLALTGINAVGLYCEDTYEIPGEPFFGYLRGRYTYEELKELDDYADALGIELFPCIQTLGHLEQILRWPVYSDVVDTPNVLLANHEPTYVLIGKMLDAASKPFRSKRMHVGMDEAHGVGTGRYRKLFGKKSPFDILNEHLDRVKRMCEERGLRPMIWSDMYFRLGSETHDYYDRNAVISDEVIARIPQGVDLVYWDYYHSDREFYEEWIRRHKKLGSTPVVASGVWTWNRLWTAQKFTEMTVRPCMEACRAHGVREAFVTIWGDDGSECELFSAMPGIQYFAELGYHETVEEAELHRHFRGVTGASFKNWTLAGELSEIPGIKITDWATNVYKWLLWEDPMLGFLAPDLGGVPLKPHFKRIADGLAQAVKEEGNCPALAMAAQLAKVLELKCDLRDEAVAAYMERNRKAVQQLAQDRIPELTEAVELLWKRHRQRWMDTYKPFGWEVLEHRYGGLILRLKTFGDRLQGWLSGEYDALSELEVALQPIALNCEYYPAAYLHRDAKTPSIIK